jgi:hypothetical protein
MTILIKDDFFGEDLAKLIVKSTDTFQWSYNHKSDIYNPAHNTFFVSYLWTSDSEDNLFHRLWKLTQQHVREIKDFHCWRIIANGQVKGQNGNWHSDHGDITLLYFPLEWLPEWGGSTYFRLNDAETEEVKYRKNRLIVFDAHTLHYGSCPTINNVLRISIAFNLRIKEEKSN